MGCHFLLQGILPTEESNPHLLHWQADALQLSRQRLLQMPSSRNYLQREFPQGWEGGCNGLALKTPHASILKPTPSIHYYRQPPITINLLNHSPSQAIVFSEIKKQTVPPLLSCLQLQLLANMLVSTLPACVHCFSTWTHLILVLPQWDKHYGLPHFNTPENASIRRLNHEPNYIWGRGLGVLLHQDTSGLISIQCAANTQVQGIIAIT